MAGLYGVIRRATKYFCSINTTNQQFDETIYFQYSLAQMKRSDIDNHHCNTRIEGRSLSNAIQKG